MFVKPNTAFTGVPSGRVIGGSAWKARKMNPEPSISTRCMEVSAGTGPTELSGVSMSAVARSFFQDVDARAVGAHHLVALDAEEHARMAQGTAVAGDGAVFGIDGLRWKICRGRVRHGRVCHGRVWAVRHFGPRSGGLSTQMIAMPRMRSTMLSLLCLGLVAALLSLTGCTTELAPPGPSTMRPSETADAFLMPDGVRLPVRVWLPKGVPPRKPAAVVLALHGMNDSRDAWEIPASEFAAGGIALYSPDQRGFGGTTTRGYWPGTQGLVDDARVMTQLLRQRYPGVPVYLMGESMGAAVLMVLATEPHAPKVAGYVLVAPAVWGRAQMNFFLR